MTDSSDAQHRPDTEVKLSEKEFGRESDFHSNVYHAIIDSKHHQDLVYTEISPLWGKNVVRFLNEALEGKHVR
jgi:hypothetical protein